MKGGRMASPAGQPESIGKGGEKPPSRLADEIADEQQLHLAYSTDRVSRITVTLI